MANWRRTDLQSRLARRNQAAYESFAGAPAPLWGDAATEAGLRFRRFPSFKNAYSEKMLAAIEAHGHGGRRRL